VLVTRGGRCEGGPKGSAKALRNQEPFWVLGTVRHVPKIAQFLQVSSFKTTHRPILSRNKEGEINYEKNISLICVS